MKFVNNQVFTTDQNEERLSFNSKHKKYQWDLHDELLVKTFQRIVASKRYQEYIVEESLVLKKTKKSLLGNYF